MPVDRTHIALAELPTCRRCPRLTAHRDAIRETYPDYQASPIGGWGPRSARLLVVGLAPGLHGAARTGKAFVGDASGEFLFAALHAQGFASDPDPERARLIGARITNAVKCLPPGNAPAAAEVNECRRYLAAELEHHCPSRARRGRLVIALGGVAHRAVCRTLGLNGVPFAHHAIYQVSTHLRLLSAFHPSRLNVNTGRITQPMLRAVFASAGEYLSV